MLESLKVQELSHHLPNFDVDIVVIDNDLTGENKKTVDSHNADSPFRILLFEEPKRGIPFARNKAVAVTSQKDAIIFLDDDEVVPAGWLETMLDTWIQSNVDIVTGPVKAILPDDAPVWAKKSNTYSEQRRYKTGVIVPKAYTNNTLISRKALDSEQPPFDTFFRYSGSEDINFFQRLTLKNFQIMWCAEAEVYEIVPYSRLKFLWLVKRSFRNGSGDTLSRLRIDSSLENYFFVFKRGVGRCLYGSIFFTKGVFTLNWESLIRGFRMFIAGFGTFAGILGIQYQEYKIIHGE